MNFKRMQQVTGLTCAGQLDLGILRLCELLAASHGTHTHRHSLFFSTSSFSIAS